MAFLPTYSIYAHTYSTCWHSQKCSDYFGNPTISTISTYQYCKTYMSCSHTCTCYTYTHIHIALTYLPYLSVLANLRCLYLLYSVKGKYAYTMCSGTVPIWKICHTQFYTNKNFFIQRHVWVHNALRVSLKELCDWPGRHVQLYTYCLFVGWEQPSFSRPLAVVLHFRLGNPSGFLISRDNFDLLSRKAYSADYCWQLWQ